MKNEKKTFGAALGRIWSQYSFIFVLFIIMIGYAITIQANGNTFNFGINPGSTIGVYYAF